MALTAPLPPGLPVGKIATDKGFGLATKTGGKFVYIAPGAY